MEHSWYPLKLIFGDHWHFVIWTGFHKQDFISSLKTWNWQTELWLNQTNALKTLENWRENPCRRPNARPCPSSILSYDSDFYKRFLYILEIFAHFKPFKPLSGKKVLTYTWAKSISFFWYQYCRENHVKRLLCSCINGVLQFHHRPLADFSII